MATAHEALLSYLQRLAYQNRPDEPFKLVSGAESTEYIDCKQALCRPEAMRALGHLVLSKLRADVVAIGGLTMGADPIAMSTSMATAGTSRPVRWFSIRKDPKPYGNRKSLVGDVERDEKVAIVDDVLTSGKSTLHAIFQSLKYGFDVAQVIVLVDRQQNGGLEKVKHIVGETVPVTVLYTIDDLRA